MVKYKNFGGSASFASQHSQHSTRTTTTAHRSADREGEETICSNVAMMGMEDNDSSHHQSTFYSSSEASSTRRTKKLSFVGYVPFPTYQATNYHHPIDNDNTSHTHDSQSYATGTTGTKSTNGTLALRIDDTSTSRRRRGAGLGLSDMVPENDHHDDCYRDEEEDVPSAASEEDKRDDMDATYRPANPRNSYAVEATNSAATCNTTASPTTVLKESASASASASASSMKAASAEEYSPHTPPTPSLTLPENQGSIVGEVGFQAVVDSRNLRRQRLALRYTSNKATEDAVAAGAEQSAVGKLSTSPETSGTNAASTLRVNPNPLPVLVASEARLPTTSTPLSPVTPRMHGAQHPLSPAITPRTSMVSRVGNRSMTSPPKSPLSPGGGRGSRLAKILRKNKPEPQSVVEYPPSNGTSPCSVRFEEDMERTTPIRPTMGSPSKAQLSPAEKPQQQTDRQSLEQHYSPLRVSSSASQHVASPASFTAAIGKPQSLVAGRRVQPFPEDMIPPSLDDGSPSIVLPQQRNVHLNHHQMQIQRPYNVQQQQTAQYQLQQPYPMMHHHRTHLLPHPPQPYQQQQQSQNFYVPRMHPNLSQPQPQASHHYPYGNYDSSGDRIRNNGAHQFNYPTEYQPSHQHRQLFSHQQQTQEPAPANEHRLAPVMEEKSGGSSRSPHGGAVSSEWTTEENQPFMMCGPDGPQLKNIRFVTAGAGGASTFGVDQCEPVSLKVRHLLATLVSTCSAIAGKGYHTDSKLSQFKKEAEKSIASLASDPATGKLDSSTKQDFESATFLIGTQWRNYSSYFGGSAESFNDNGNDADEVESNGQRHIGRSCSGQPSMDREGSSHSNSSVGTNTPETPHEDSFAANARRFFRAGNDMMGNLPISDLQNYAGSFEQGNPKMIKDVKNLFDTFQRYYEPDEILYEDNQNVAETKYESTSRGGSNLIGEYKMLFQEEVTERSEAAESGTNAGSTLEEERKKDEAMHGTSMIYSSVVKATNKNDMHIGFRRRRNKILYPATFFGPDTNEDEISECQNTVNAKKYTPMMSVNETMSKEASQSLSPIRKGGAVAGASYDASPSLGDKERPNDAPEAAKSRRSLESSNDVARLNRIYRNLHTKIHKNEGVSIGLDVQESTASTSPMRKDNLLEDLLLLDPEILVSHVTEDGGIPDDGQIISSSGARSSGLVETKRDVMMGESEHCEEADGNEQSSDEEFGDAEEMEHSSTDDFEDATGHSPSTRSSGSFETAFISTNDSGAQTSNLSSHNKPADNDDATLQNAPSLQNKSVDSEELLSVFLAATKNIEIVDDCQQDTHNKFGQKVVAESCNNHPVPSPSSSMSDSLVGSDVDEDVRQDSFLEESPAPNSNRASSCSVREEYHLPHYDASEEVGVHHESPLLALKPVLGKHGIYSVSDDNNDALLRASFEHSEFPHTLLDVIQESPSEGSLCEYQGDDEHGNYLSDEDFMDGSRVASSESTSTHRFDLFAESSKSDGPRPSSSTMETPPQAEVREPSKSEPEPFVDDSKDELFSTPTRHTDPVNAPITYRPPQTKKNVAFGVVGKVILVSVAIYYLGLMTDSWERVDGMMQRLYQYGINHVAADGPGFEFITNSPYQPQVSKSLAALRDEELQTLTRLVQDALGYTKTEPILAGHDDVGFYRAKGTKIAELPAFPSPILKSEWIVELEAALEEEKATANE